MGEDNPQSDLENEENDAVYADDEDQVSFDESGNSPDSSDVESADDEHAPATGGGGFGSLGPATGGGGGGGDGGGGGPPLEATFGAGNVSIFDNGYFQLKGHEFDLKMYIHERWLIPPPNGMGRRPTMTKTISPGTVGETRAEPTRSVFCLRAWMLWRARGAEGWLDRSAIRSRLFEEEADRLYADIRRIQPQADGLLGNPTASQLLQHWAPDIVARLHSSAAGPGPATGGPG